MEMLRDIPGPFSLPFVGSLTLWRYISKSDYLESFWKFCQPYGPYILGWVGNTAALIISDPTDVRTVLSRVSKTKKDGYTIHDVKRFSGNGLLTADNDLWKVQRKTLNKLFRSHRLEQHVATFQKHAEKLVETLSNQRSPDVDLWHTFSRSSLSVAYDTLIGPITVTNEEVVNELGTWVARIGELAGMRMIYPILRIEFLFEFLTPWGKEFKVLLSKFRAFIWQVIENRKPLFNEEQFDQDNSTMIETLLKESCSTEQIIDELATMTAASSDTSATVLAYAMIALGLHTHIQDNVYCEVMNVLGPRGAVNSENLNDLKYTEMVILETMRRFPIVPFLTRVPLTDLKLKSFTAPANSLIILNFLSMHRNEKYWHDPLSFKPERFSRENTGKDDLNAFFPFGGGPRVCIGQKFAVMELKTLLANVVRKYKISTNYKNIDEVKLVCGIITRTLNGTQCTLEEREPLITNTTCT
ncbi:cytochrome p450 [Rhyzopertha dominica]|nr:cytochrome p450 [Rhyzopertha dominica]